MRALVVGIANLQTTVPVDNFPMLYEPVRYLPGRLTDSVGGVGFNQARQLAALGDHVRLAAPLGDDLAGQLVLAEAAGAGIDTSCCATSLRSTPRSVVLVDGAGRRQINTDLGDALTSSWDVRNLRSAIDDSDAVILGNLDVNRPLLAAVRSGRCVTAVDLQAVQGSHNPYDQEFLQADLVAMSGELVAGRELEVLSTMHRQSRAILTVMTLGNRGSLALGVDLEGVLETPAALVGPTTDTTGAGDCFFAALVHHLVADRLPVQQALRSATAAAARFLAGPGLTDRWSGA